MTAILTKKGFTVQVERGAGVGAKFRDDDYVQAGGIIVDGTTAFQSDILLKVRQPHESDIPLIKKNSTLISFLYPAQNKELVSKLAERKINAFGKYFCRNFVLMRVEQVFSMETPSEQQLQSLQLFVFQLFLQQWTAFHAFRVLRYLTPSAQWLT